MSIILHLIATFVFPVIQKGKFAIVNMASSFIKEASEVIQRYAKVPSPKTQNIGQSVDNFPLIATFVKIFYGNSS